mgnify:CR=1 FL=1
MSPFRWDFLFVLICSKLLIYIRKRDSTTGGKIRVKIDAVFSGGGIKGYAFLGTMASLEKKGFSIERVAGTSAGAIFASLLAAGYHYQDLEKILDDLDLQNLLDPPRITNYIPFSKWIFLYFQMGLYKGDKFEEWVYDHLARKKIFTFKDVRHDYLKVIVSDLSLGKMVVIPDDLKRVYNIDPAKFSVAKAVRMSAGFPYFFMPKKVTGKNNIESLIVDGGLLSNFPLWVFDNGHKLKRPVLGVKISDETSNIETDHIKNAIDMFTHLFSTMKTAHDARYVSKNKEHQIIFIPVKDVNTMDFKITKNTKEYLINTGKCQ